MRASVAARRSPLARSTSQCGARRGPCSQPWRRTAVHDARSGVAPRAHGASGAATTTTAAAADPRWPPCPLGEELIAWVRRHGGHLDPRLTITERAPSGSRGVVATAPIAAAADPAAAALLRVPEALYMTSDAATQILQTQVDRHEQQQQQKQGGSAGTASAPSGGGPFAWLRGLAPGAASGVSKPPPPPVSEVDPLTRLSLLLAYERTKGPASFWHPYIASLSPKPPCAWRLPPPRLAAALSGIAAARGLPAIALSDWHPAVVRAGSIAHARAAALAAAYGAALGIGTDEIVWAMAHVVSRAFGDDSDAALAPLIDSCNHRGGAGKPFPLLAAQGGGSGGDAVSGEGVLVCVAPESEGRPAALAAGDEFCISYGAIDGGREGALEIFLTFGFIPEDVPL